MKRAILLFALVACHTKAISAQNQERCSNGQGPTDGDLVLDKAMKKYFISERFKAISLPKFNYTVRVAMWNYLIEFYNGTIFGLSAVERLGVNYMEAETNKSMRIRVALKLEGLNISVAARTKRFLWYTYFEADVFAPASTFVAEIKEINNTLMLKRLEMNDTSEVKVQFRFLSPILRLLNKLTPLQRYINKRINEHLEAELFYAVDEAVHALGERRAELQCTRCTTFEAVLRNALTSYKLDPSPLPALTTDLFAKLASVKVSNGTIRGLSRMRQSGDVVARIDECGAYVYADVTVRNLTVTLAVNVRTFMADFRAIVSTNISARFIIEVVEQNATFLLKTLVVNTTDRVYATVTPIGAVSSLAALFLPARFIAEMTKRELQPLTKSTIQGSLYALHDFAHGNNTKG
ncbi:uncharacterized protein [Dermacentor albipictus]|uniref:uncharacterized protein isoform X1 n=2 Tax=Dermacentor albipictus TaxID=60249 RepID=UPI0031FE31DE